MSRIWTALRSEMRQPIITNQITIEHKPANRFINRMRPFLLALPSDATWLAGTFPSPNGAHIRDKGQPFNKKLSSGEVKRY